MPTALGQAIANLPISSTLENSCEFILLSGSPEVQPVFLISSSIHNYINFKQYFSIFVLELSYFDAYGCGYLKSIWNVSLPKHQIFKEKK